MCAQKTSKNVQRFYAKLTSGNITYEQLTDITL